MKNKFNTATFLRQLTLTLIAVMLTATTAWAQGLSGTGTDFDPYLITSKDDWNTFASQVSGGNTSYSGKYFVLTADISVNVMVGTKTNPFSGTFDGSGHTLTVDLENTEDYTAPFRYVSGATFQNLHTEGNIKVSKQWASGLISHAEGDVKISSCWSSVTIKNTAPSWTPRRWVLRFAREASSAWARPWKTASTWLSNSANSASGLSP